MTVPDAPSLPALPATMPAAVYLGDRVVAVEDRPVPPLGDHDVLLEVSHCGICGSDLHMVLDGWGQPGSVGGHEYSGRIVAVGPEVTAWSVGDEAVAGPGISCGTCDQCVGGRPSLCRERTGPMGGEPSTGAFARYKRIEDRRLLRLPDGVSLRTSALTEPLAVALHGITKGRPRPGERVLVTGAGPIGLLIIAVLKADGIDDVTVSEPGALRRDRAVAVGARTAVMPDELPVPAMPSDWVDEPFDVAFECSGRADAMEAALGQLGPTGRLVLVGAGVRRPRWDPMRILLNELVITGAYEYDGDGFERALELLASGRLPTDLLIEPADVPLPGLGEAIVALASGELAAKVLVVPETTTEGGR